MKASAHAIGGEGFVERMEKSLRDRSRGDASDADVSLPWSGVEFDAIDRVVSKKYRIRPEDLRLGLPLVPSYSASDPGEAVQVVTNGGVVTTTYTPAAGAMRLWTVDSTTERNTNSVAEGGHWIPPNVPLTYAQVFGSAAVQVVDLYIEGVNPCTAADGLIRAEFAPLGGLYLPDEVHVTVLSVDFKRDGTCSGFDDTLTPPWIMLPKTGSNTAIAEIDPAAIANQIGFVSVDTSKATVSPSTASASPQTVTVSGVAKGDTEIQAKPSGSNTICATLNASVKERIDKTIAIHAITEENDDVQEIPVGQGQPNQACITAGTNSVLDTTPAGDDTVVGATITTGPDGICNTAASGDDVQVIAVGNGKANAICVTKGENGFRDSTPSGDDIVTDDDDIHTGPDGLCNTPANASNLVPTTCPTAAQLQSYLNDTIWGRQANVYFTVTKSDYTVNYDLDRSGTLAHPSKGPAPNPAEGQAISSVAKDTSVDYNIYYVFARDYSIGTTRIDLGETWTAADGANSPVNHTAHEIGHLLGIGYESFNDEDVMLFEGRASNPCRVIKRDWDTVNP